MSKEDVQAALKRSERRFRAAMEAVDGIVWTNDPKGRMKGAQPGWEALTGQREDDYQGYGWTQRVHPDDARPTIRAWERAVERKGLFTFEHRVKRADGSWGWYAARAVPVLGDDGEIEEWVGIHEDITHHKAAEAALRRERDRAQLYLQVADVMLLVLDRVGRIEVINRRGAEILGHARPEALIGEDWFGLAVPENERARVREAFRSLMKGELQPAGMFENTLVSADGTERLIAWRNTVLRDESGEIVGTLSSGEDVTERRAAAVKERLLAEEIDHRAKNLLSVIQAILQLTRATDIGDFRSVVSGRVDALAKTHGILAASRWSGVDLGQLVRGELAGADGPDPRVRIEGPPILLTPSAAQVMAIVLHELAINAESYGALSVPAGQVTVEWDVEEGGDRLARLRWREKGGPETAPPASLGFGSAVLKSSIERQLKGRLSLDWKPGGLECAIEAPIGKLVQPEGAAARPRIPVLVVEPDAAEGNLRSQVAAAGFTVLDPAADPASAAALIDEAFIGAAVVSADLPRRDAAALGILFRDAGVPFVYCGGAEALQAMPDGAAAMLDETCDGRVLAAILEVAARRDAET